MYNTQPSKTPQERQERTGGINILPPSPTGLVGASTPITDKAREYSAWLVAQYPTTFFIDERTGGVYNAYEDYSEVI